MAINIKDEMIKGCIAMCATAIGGGISAVITAAINKRANRDEKMMDLAKAKALIQKLDRVQDLSTKQSVELARALKTVFIDDVERIKVNVISAVIIGSCSDKDNAIVDIEHRLTVRGPVTRDTISAQKQWLENELEGLNRAYGIDIVAAISI